MNLLTHINDLAFFVLMLLGLYIVTISPHLMKKIIGLSIFQSSIFVFYISMGKITGGTDPILLPRFTLYANPLPQVLILTAIVVGISTTAIALALCVAIKKSGASMDESDLASRARKKYISQDALENKTTRPLL